MRRHCSSGPRRRRSERPPPPTRRVRLRRSTAASARSASSKTLALPTTTACRRWCDGDNNDRPIIDGKVVERYAFRGTPTSEIAVFGEGRLLTGRPNVTLRVEAFNLFNHANILGRNSTYGDGATPLRTFGQALGGLA